MPDPHLTRHPSHAQKHRDLLIMSTLVTVTLVIYAQVLGHQFINLDDPRYLYENPAVKAGLTLRGITWAFLTLNGANWHPITWIAHMIDWQMFGLNAGGHLLVNASIHAANAALVFWLLRRATGSVWPSAIVAALFAWHPLHVESVAWAAERKDTLSTFFGLLALIAYVRYTEFPSWRRYTAVAVMLALGLMAKPMLVTWPFVMLLFDYWPLGRFRKEEAGVKRSVVTRLVIEKLPFFVLVVLSSLITFIAQTQGGALRTVGAIPVGLRFCNALIAFTRYLSLTFWPHNLAPYYPYVSVVIWDAIFAAVGLAAITAICLTERKSRPYLLVGWLWFLGTLVPVIGIVQVGDQAMADRYHYIPSIGLFMAVVFGLAGITARRKSLTIGASALTVAALVLLAGLTFRQIQLWQNSITLFEHSLRVAPRSNLMMHYNLGLALNYVGRQDEAATHFEKALEVDPDFAPALYNMGVIRQKNGRMSEALSFYKHAVRSWPYMPQAHIGLGMLLVAENKIDLAVTEFQEAARLDPWSAEARSNLGLALAKTGRTSQGIEVIRELSA